MDNEAKIIHLLKQIRDLLKQMVEVMPTPKQVAEELLDTIDNVRHGDDV